MYEITLIRKVTLNSGSPFLSIPHKLLQGETRFTVTVSPIDEWGRHVSFVRELKVRRRDGSVRLGIPRSVYEYLKIQHFSDKYVWVRLRKYNEDEDEPLFPKYPYMALFKSINKSPQSYFMIFSRTYLDEMVKALGRMGLEWSGKVYFSIKLPDTGDYVRTILKVNNYKYKVYHILLPAREFSVLTYNNNLRRKKAYTVISPLPRGYSERIIINPPPAFPL